MGVEMVLKLVELTESLQPSFIKMMDAWTTQEDEIIPNAINEWNYLDFKNYVEYLKARNDLPDMVPSTTLFCIDQKSNEMIGACNIRHFLNENFMTIGGHIGLGICPEYRGKGHGTTLLALALEECKHIGLSEILITCSSDNISSAKIIMKNGGILEKEITFNGIKKQRYWINLY